MGIRQFIAIQLHLWSTRPQSNLRIFKSWGSIVDEWRDQIAWCYSRRSCNPKMPSLYLHFQTFVFMQVFNQINAKKIELGELNIFKGIFNNMLFVWITLLTFIIQMGMVEYGGKFVKAYPLKTNENLVCLIIGAMELLVGVLIKFLPLSLF